MVQHKYQIIRPFAIYDGVVTTLKDAKEKTIRQVKGTGMAIPTFVNKVFIYNPSRNKNSWFYFDYASRKKKVCQTDLTTQLVALGYLEHVGKRDRWGARQPVTGKMTGKFTC